ncbi:MAG: argininosuccinate synthase [Synergistaceae bacterium]|nr:argininosuccinate synthase [Synergistaceae bacterium]MBQ7069299.1 argininosuccinate synthase [Synergistaceae bacterium]MBR0075859.1 argininosuccinate synthase [Synergistaceae bacterium]MBR0080513.1 argininosuccinate synthase [Synergistaceae bacterium]MBR0234185.1 argininosuccinate synthase [Synergistaceae bacterium]
MAEKKGKVVLAYSGGLDTSVAVMWLTEQGYDVITMTADVGQKDVDLQAAKSKALHSGAVKAYIFDLKKTFVENYVYPSLRANAMYQGTYPLVSALSRPLIAKTLVDIANKEGAVAVAHGCTGKGQDQVRIEVCATALNPKIKVLAPVRDWHFTREAEIEYASKHGIPVRATAASPYSTDDNLWGRSIECGLLEDPWNEPPEDAYEMTSNPIEAPDNPEFVEISFEGGIPVELNGERMHGVELIQKLNKIAGRHGIGRIDMIEDRLVGFKSREVYECPGSTVLLAAHRAMETLTLDKQVLKSKRELEIRFAELTYEGYWFSPLRDAINAFMNDTQKFVNGTVKMRLFKGQAVVRGLKTSKSIYRHDLATYSEGDTFDHSAAVGFINIWGLPVRTWTSTWPRQDAAEIPIEA